MAEVIISNVSKRYDGAIEALAGVSLRVRDGEFLAVVGPSGCGKTTLLRIVSGLEDVSGGTVSIGGNDVTGVPPKARNVAMVFQTSALLPHLNVQDNMGFGLRLRKLPAQEIAARVQDAAGFLGLSSFLKRLPAELSGGERQRVALGRAMVHKPSVFLLDEPLSHLDARLKVEIRGEICALQKRLRATMIYVTHDQVEAMAFGGTMAVMQGGRIEQVGSAAEVYERPANMFVASFIGTPALNIIRKTDSLFTELANGAEWSCECVGFRPEHVRLVDDPASVPAGFKCVRGKVKNVSYAGHESHVEVDCSGLTVRVRVQGEFTGSCGRDVVCAFEMARTLKL